MMIRKINSYIAKTRIVLIIALTLYAVSCLVNMCLQLVSVCNFADPKAETAVVMSFNALMLLVHITSTAAFVGQSHRRAAAALLLLVLHSVILFCKFISVISTLYPGFPIPSFNGTRVNGTTNEASDAQLVPLFDFASEGPYEVPNSFVAYGFVSTLLHLVVVLLIDYVRRLNIRLQEVQEAGSQDDGLLEESAAPVAPADLMNYAASPVHDSQSPDQNRKSA